MTKQVEIEARKSFNKTPQGDLCNVGERFHVDETRAEELQRLGLAVRAKDSPAPQTATAPKPANKVKPSPKTSEG